MPWMQEADRERLRAELEDTLRVPVEISVTMGGGGHPRTLGVLEELVSLSPLLRLVRKAPTGRDPEIELRGASRGRVAFLGLPMGYEFPTLVEAIQDVSRGATSLDEEVRARLAGIRAPRELQVFTSST